MSSLITTTRTARPAEALRAYALHEGEPWERDYARVHLRDWYGDSLEWRAAVVRLSVWIEAVEDAADWGNNLLRGVPEEALCRFALACALRSLARDERSSGAIEEARWEALEARLAWVRGEEVAPDEAPLSADPWIVESIAWAVIGYTVRASAWDTERRWQIQTLAELCRRWAGRIER